MGFIYLTSAAVWEQVPNVILRIAKARCYHHNGMKAQTIGRTLGIGLRVAGRIVGKTVTASAQASASARQQYAEVKAEVSQNAGRAAGQASRNAARGVGGFLRPFRRIGGILFLEVTGAFFFLFVLVSASFLWKNRASYASGPAHRQFMAGAAMLLVFLYLTVSSFWRARKK